MQDVRQYDDRRDRAHFHRKRIAAAHERRSGRDDRTDRRARAEGEIVRAHRGAACLLRAVFEK